MFEPSYCLGCLTLPLAQVSDSLWACGTLCEFSSVPLERRLPSTPRAFCRPRGALRTTLSRRPSQEWRPGSELIRRVFGGWSLGCFHWDFGAQRKPVGLILVVSLLVTWFSFSFCWVCPRQKRFCARRVREATPIAKEDLCAPSALFHERMLKLWRGELEKYPI